MPQSDLQLYEQIKKTSLPLHNAVLQRHLGVVELLLKEEEDSTIQNVEGKTPMMIAADKQYWACIQKFCEFDRTPDKGKAGYSYALQVSVFRKKHEVVEALLNAGAMSVHDVFSNMCLPEAARNGDTRMVELLLKHGANSGVCDHKKKYPLVIAANKQDWKCVLTFCEHDQTPDKSKSGYSHALDAAVSCQNYEASEALLNAGAQPGGCLNTAVEKKDARMVILLLTHGASSAEQSNALQYLPAKAAHKEAWECVLAFCEHDPITDKNNPAYSRALELTVWHQNHEVAEALLKAGANPNPTQGYSESCLHSAAKNGDARMIELLLTYGANSAVCNSDRQYPLILLAYAQNWKCILEFCKHDKTADKINAGYPKALQLAIYYGNHPAAEALLKAMTAAASAVFLKDCLAEATSRTDPAMVELLLRYKADPNTPASNGEYPLIIATESRNSNTIAVLLRNGAISTIRNRSNKSPIMIAADNHDLECVQKFCVYDPSDKNSEEYAYALCVAISNGHQKIVNALLQAKVIPPANPLDLEDLADIIELLEQTASVLKEKKQDPKFVMDLLQIAFALDRGDPHYRSEDLTSAVREEIFSNTDEIVTATCLEILNVTSRSHKNHSNSCGRLFAMVKQSTAQAQKATEESHKSPEGTQGRRTLFN